MTAFIKNLREKRQEWRGERPRKVWSTSQAVRQTIESLPSFKKVQAEMDAGVAQVQERLKDERESDAKRQRWKTRTSEEKARECMDSLAKTIKEHGEMGVNDVKTFDEATRKAEQIAYKHDRIKDGE